VVATFEKRRTERSRNVASRAGARASSGPENRAIASPSRPPIQIAAAMACTQSAKKGKKRASAAAWLSWVRVIRSMLPIPAAAHHSQAQPNLTAAVIATVVSTPKPSRASQTAPTLLSSNASLNRSLLRGSPEARIAYADNSPAPATAST
jgi:hypothetical protein